MSLEPPALDVISGATLAGAAFDLPVERGPLLSYLRELGPLTLAEGKPSGGVAITCELWTVTDGRAMPGGVDPYALAGRWGGVLAGMTALGPYHELLIGVPDVCVGDGAVRHLAVLAMITDSPIAHAIDGWFGYGYRKRLGRFTRPRDGIVEVRVGGDLVLAAELELDDEPRGARPHARLEERWRQPLLGGLHDAALRASSLERRLGPGARCARIRGRIELTWPEPGVLPSGDHAIGGSGSGGIQPAAFANVASRITSPRSVG